MKKIFLYICLFAISLAAVTPCYAQVEPPMSLIITCDDGTVFDISKLRGKNVMISFFASWCRPCKSELDELERIYRNDKNAAIIAINLDDSESEDFNLEEFRAKYSFKFAKITDAQVNDFGRPKKLPTLYVIDENGFLK